MSRALAWICLALLASTSAYGLHLTAVAMAPASDAAHQITSATVTRKVLLVAVDPVTGDRAQAECDVSYDDFTSDMFLVDASDFRALAQNCA